METTGSRGVSKVLGTLLVVAITVVLAATVGATFLDAGEKLRDPSPVAASQVQSEWDLGSKHPTQRLVVRHHSGDPVDADHLEVVYSTDSGSVQYSVPRTGDLSDGTWNGGDELVVPVDEDAVCRGGDVVDVQLVYDHERRSSIVATHQVPITHSSFDISGGRVVPKHEYSTEVTVVGSAITYGSGGPNMPVEVGVEIGGTSVPTAWPGDVNDGGNPRSSTFTKQKAGAGIAVVATSKYPSGSHYMTARSTDGTDQVLVLRDGDTVPTVGGFSGQADASSYLTPYVDGNEIDLQRNQAIYLFELGTTDTTSAAFDRQDAVVVATMWSETSTPVFVDGTTSEHEVVCPK